MSAILERFDILKIRAYFYFFIGTTISFIGSGMQFLANGWLAMQLTGSSYAVAIVLVCSTIPGILLSPVIGVFVDRYDRRWLSMFTDTMRALVLLSIPFLWWYGLLRPWHLYAMSFLVAVGDQMYNPTINALIREIVPKEQLLKANATTQMALQTGALIGTAAGGVIIALFSPVAIMLINSASFFISAFCTFRMRSGRVIPSATNHKARGFGPFFRQMREGVRYIDSHRHIILTYMMMLFLLTTFRTINVLLAPYSKDVLKVGSVGFGLIDGAFAVGAVVGALFLPACIKKFKEKYVMVGFVGGLSLGMLWFSLAGNLLTAILGYFVIGVFYQARTLFLTTAQHSIDLDFQGRVHSVFNTCFSVISLGIYLLMGYLGEVVSQRWLFGFQAFLMLVAMVVAYFVLVRQKQIVKEEVYETV